MTDHSAVQSRVFPACNHDVALPQYVFIKSAYANATIQCRYRLSERRESALQAYLRLRRQSPQRSDEDNPSASGKAPENAEFGNPCLSGACGQGHHQVIALIYDARRRSELGGPKIDFGSAAAQQKRDEGFPKSRPLGVVAAVRQQG